MLKKPRSDLKRRDTYYKENSAGKRERQQQIQKKAFTAWINTELSDNPDEEIKKMKLENIYEDLDSGVILINLMETISAKKIGKYKKNAKHKLHKIENLNKALKFMRSQGVHLVNISAEDILSKNEVCILGLIWTLILRYQINKSWGAAGESKDLLGWVNDKISPYGLIATNFTTSFQDPRTFRALVNALSKGCMPVNPPRDTDQEQAMDEAMDFAEDSFDIPKMLDANDVIMSPDNHSIMTYVSYYRKKENNLKKKLARKADIGKSWAEGPGLAGKGVSQNPEKILIVLTNHDELGNTEKKTGWYLPEVAHPLKVFKDAGYMVDFVTPLGEYAPMDPSSKEAFEEDPVCKAFLENTSVMRKFNFTKHPRDVDIKEYKAMYYAGGHGAMFDLPQNKKLANMCAAMYDSDGVVGAVCHGIAGLVNVVVADGTHLLNGQTMTCFTNAEEEAIELTDEMPFPLETKCKERGANFVGSDDWQENVQVSSDRLVTGQNPASSTLTAEKIIELIKEGEKKKVLVIVANSGNSLPNVAHIVKEATNEGYTTHFASPDGGAATMDPLSVEKNRMNPTSANFMENASMKSALKSTMKLSVIKASRYEACILVGGPGAFDVAESADAQSVATACYENGAVVGAIGEGAMVLANTSLSDGKPFLANHKLATISDTEAGEDLPSSVAALAAEKGAHIYTAEDSEVSVEVSNLLVSGQNDASSKVFAKTLMKKLNGETPNVIAMVVTSNDSELDGKKTGWCIGEVAYPYQLFKSAGYAVEFLSPAGGATTQDTIQENAFLGNQKARSFLAKKKGHGSACKHS